MRAASQRGFGLIEVLVALALAALLLSLAAPSFVTGNQNRQIRTAAEAIQNGLQLARTEALRRNRPMRFEFTAPSGWRVGCDTPDATIIDGQEACPATIQTRESTEGTANASVEALQIVATSGSEASSPVFTGNLRFTPLGRVAASGSSPTAGDGTLPAGNLAHYRVSNPNGGTCVAAGGEMRCLTVVVTTAGLVRMCDPAVTAGDPRAC